MLIDDLIHRDENFYKIFSETAKIFVERHQKKTGETENFDFLFNNCLNYVKEECAVMSLWLPRRYDYEVYPGKRIKAMVLTHEYFIKPESPEILQWLRIQFKFLAKNTSIAIANSA